MKLARKKCRCCGGENFERCGTRRIEPFFAAYGLHLGVVVDPRRKLGRVLRRIGAEAAAAKLARSLGSIEIAYGACSDCRYIAPWPELSDDMLLDYYSGYGSTSYKAERKLFDPGYAAIAALHGSADELALRRREHEGFFVPLIEKHLPGARRPATVLDYGGGSGQVAPRAAWMEVDLYDVGENRVQALTRRGVDVSRSPTDRSDYDVVQLLHVLEHVGHPRATLDRACRFLSPSGLLYVEVPWEMDDFDALSATKRRHCDEHINLFCERSVRALVGGLGLEVVTCEEGFIHLLHLPEPYRVVRCLARRKEPSARAIPVGRRP